MVGQELVSFIHKHVEAAETGSPHLVHEEENKTPHLTLTGKEKFLSNVNLLLNGLKELQV